MGDQPRRRRAGARTGKGDDDRPGPADGQRERRRQDRRRDLSLAALQLAVDRGLENVAVVDIATAAGVAPRTFTQYFPSKEAAIVAGGRDRPEVLHEALRSRPDAEPVWAALRAAVRQQFTAVATHDPAWLARAQLIKASLALQAEQQRSDLAVVAMLAEEIARRTGTDPERDLYPRLTAAAVMAAVRAALDHWLAAHSEQGRRVPVTVAVDEALRALAAGLPVPSR